MPALDRITILKVPAKGTAHFANTSLNELQREVERDTGSGAGSLSVYVVSGSAENERFTVDTVLKLKNLSTAVVSRPKVVRAIQRQLTTQPHPDVIFFALDDDGVTVHQTVIESKATTPRYDKAARLLQAFRHSTLISVRWSNPKVPLAELWEAFRETLGVTKDGYPRIPLGAEVRPAQRESATQAAINLQNEFIARGWPTSAQVGRANGSRTSVNPNMWASDHRKAGALLGAWSPQDRAYLHPDFQFDATGRLRPAVKELLDALATHADLAPEADKTGWHRVFWMYGAVRDLAGDDGIPRSAAEVFPTDPQAVIAFARKDAAVDVNDVW